MIKNILIVLLCFLTLPSSAQSGEAITLEQVQQWAAAHFPLLKQKALARQASLASNSITGNNYLPQLSLNAQATWQSAVTEVPVRIPGLAFDPLAKDQYRAVLDLNQLVYDGGLTRQQKIMNELQALLKEEEVNVALHQLREKINGLYLNVLLLDAQRQQNALVMADLDAGLRKVEAQVQQGTAYRSNLALLKSEWLKARQRDIELAADREGLLQVMSEFTGQSLPATARLITPAPPALPMMTDITRPELQYYQLRDSLARQQGMMVDGRLRPRVSLFANGGYGRPGLDMLKNEFAPFVTTGVRFQWALNNFYNSRREHELSEITRRDVQAQQENFLMNTRAQLKQQASRISQLQQLLATDQEIIPLKTQVKEAAAVQLEHGVITASDYLREVHAEDQARQAQILHQLQWLQAMLNYTTTAGK
ncbi:MAG: TolC family protein [Chitinophagaceae bacterium]|jgi:outer membrane protein TolC|nr:TolC family protein [Chitinophagaceae bacterium]